MLLALIINFRQTNGFNHARTPLIAMSGSTVALSHDGTTVANNRGTIVTAKTKSKVCGLMKTGTEKPVFISPQTLLFVFAVTIVPLLFATVVPSWLNATVDPDIAMRGVRA